MEPIQFGYDSFHDRWVLWYPFQKVYVPLPRGANWSIPEALEYAYRYLTSKCGLSYHHLNYRFSSNNWVQV